MSSCPKTILAVLAALTLVPCAGVACPQAQAQSQSQAPATPAVPGQGVLSSISATGSAKFSSAQIVAATGLTVGENVTRASLQNAANLLAGTGLFSKVRYRYKSQGTKVTVEYEVADARTLPVSFDNFPWFTQQQLDDIARSAVGIFDNTAPESGSYDDAIASAIETKLHALGVPGRVEHRLIGRPVGPGMEVQYRLVGPALNVGSVQFTDPLAEHDARVAERLQDLVGKPFSRYSIRLFDTEQVLPIYLSQGYLLVRFGPAEARFTGNPNAGVLSPVMVIVPITPGPRFTWAGATWTGNTAITAAALDRMIDLTPGATADGLAIEAGWEKIRQAFGSQGYLDVALDPQPVYDDAKSSVSYDVKITEGRPYKMGKLVIDGLFPEAEKRVRDAWKIQPGQTFDLAYFDDFLSSIVPRALADLPAHYQHIGRFLARHPDKGTVDVMLDFE